MLIHGWGLRGDVWGEAAQKLAQHFTVHRLDLPGYGASENIEPYYLEALVKSVSDYARQNIFAKNNFAQPLTVCGWSLGGQVALRWAERVPQQVQRLILVATTPCFVQRADWLCAMPQEIFQEFAQALQHNPAQTLKRFISLQVRGSEHERELLATLRGLDKNQAPLAALSSGLDILRDTDLRKSLPHIAQPTLVIAGDKDELTPAAASNYLAQNLPHARLAKIAQAAHVPFLSHADIFAKLILGFSDENAGNYSP